MLDDAIFQRMKSNGAQSPAWFHEIENLSEELFEGFQFTIYRQSQGLKGAGRRVYAETVFGLWDYPLDLFRKLKSRRKRFEPAPRSNSAGNA